MESISDDDSEPTFDIRIDTESDDDISLFHEKESKKNTQRKTILPYPEHKERESNSEDGVYRFGEEYNENELQKVCGVVPLQPATKSFRFGPEVRKVQLFFMTEVEMCNTEQRFNDLCSLLEKYIDQAEKANEGSIQANLILKSGRAYYQWGEYHKTLQACDEAMPILNAASKDEPHIAYTLTLEAHRLRYVAYGKLKQFEKEEQEMVNVATMIFSKEKNYWDRLSYFYVKATNTIAKLQDSVILRRLELRKKVIDDGVKQYKFCGACIVDGDLSAEQSLRHYYVAKMVLLYLDCPYFKQNRLYCVTLDNYMTALHMIRDNMCGYSPNHMTYRFKLHFLLILACLHYRSAQLTLVSSTKHKGWFACFVDLFDARTYLDYAYTCLLSQGGAAYDIKMEIEDLYEFLADTSLDGAHSQLIKMMGDMDDDTKEGLTQVTDPGIRSFEFSKYGSTWMGTALLDLSKVPFFITAAAWPALLKAKTVQTHVNAIHAGNLRKEPDLEADEMKRLLDTQLNYATKTQLPSTDINSQRHATYKQLQSYLHDDLKLTEREICLRSCKLICLYCIIHAKICLDFPETMSGQRRFVVGFQDFLAAYKVLDQAKTILYWLDNKALKVELLVASSSFYFRCAQAMLITKQETKCKSAFQTALLHAEMAETYAKRNGHNSAQQRRISAYKWFLDDLDKASNTRNGLCNKLLALCSLDDMAAYANEKEEMNEFDQSMVDALDNLDI